MEKVHLGEMKGLAQSHRAGQLCRQDSVPVPCPKTNLKDLERRGMKRILKSVSNPASSELLLTFSNLWFLWMFKRLFVKKKKGGGGACSIIIMLQMRKHSEGLHTCSRLQLVVSGTGRTQISICSHHLFFLKGKYGWDMGTHPFTHSLNKHWPGSI